MSGVTLRIQEKLKQLSKKKELRPGLATSYNERKL